MRLAGVLASVVLLAASSVWSQSEADSSKDVRSRGLTIDRARRRMFGAWEVPGRTGGAAKGQKRIEFFNPNGTVTTSYIDDKGVQTRTVDLGGFDLRATADGLVLTISLKPRSTSKTKPPRKGPQNEFIVEFHGDEKMVLRPYAATDAVGKRITKRDDPEAFSREPLVFARFEIGASKQPFNTAPSLNHKRAVMALRRLGALYGEKRAAILFVRATDKRIADARPHLEKLYLLKKITLAKSAISDKALAQLKDLTGTVELDLADTRVTDTGLRFLADMSNLRKLSLARTAVTDAGLEHVKALGSLVEIDLTSTSVTDRGIVHLKSLKKLKSLIARGTRISPRGAGELAESLPQLELFVIGPPLADAGK